MKKFKSLITCISFFSLIGLVSCNQANEFDTTKNISLYTRNTDSGTRDGFFTKLGFKEAVDSNQYFNDAMVTTVEKNGDMITSVKNDEYGLGYISLSSLSSSDLTGLTYEDVAPTEENVINGTYQLTRNFNYVIRAEFENDTKKQIVEAFIAYLSTQEGKATIIAKSGIVELQDTDPSWEDIKNNYPIVKQDNSKITIKFGGSTSVESIAKALSAEFSEKCGNFIAEHNHTGSSDAFKYTQGEKKDDSSKLDIGFLSREFSSSETYAENTAGKICIDAIVAVVNRANPLKKITAQELVKMYKGEIKNWSSLIK